MKIRLLLAVIFLLALPTVFSSKGVNTNSTPFVTVAIAGHTVGGNFCECGAPGCICDPGEERGGQSLRPVNDPSPKNTQKAKPGRVSEIDFGSTAFLLGLALFMWSRIRG